MYVKPVRILIEIRIVDLGRIAGEDHFGPLTRTGNNRLHFMRSQVLRFVDDHIHLRERTAADVGDSFHLDLLALHDEFQSSRPISLSACSRAEEFEVVIDRLHPMVELFFFSPRQIADILAERHDRPEIRIRE